MRIPDSIAIGVCVYFVYDRFFSSKPNPELPAATVTAEKLATAVETIKKLSNDSKKPRSFVFRNRHYVGTAAKPGAENPGNVSMIKLILNCLSKLDLNPEKLGPIEIFNHFE
jgi:hypothetical protein